MAPQSEARFDLRGEVDLAEREPLLAALCDLAQRDHDIVVDCANLTFIDSSGVGMLIEVHNEVSRRGHTMRVVNVPTTPYRVFELLGLIDVLDVRRGE